MIDGIYVIEKMGVLSQQWVPVMCADTIADVERWCREDIDTLLTLTLVKLPNCYQWLGILPHQEARDTPLYIITLLPVVSAETWKPVVSAETRKPELIPQLNSDRLNIYEYIDPNVTEDEKNMNLDIRWIAADSEDKADAEAQAHGWNSARGFIFTEQRDRCKTIGCDIVL